MELTKFLKLSRQPHSNCFSVFVDTKSLSGYTHVPNYRSLLAESPFQNGHHAYEIALPGCGDPQCRYLGTDV
jgi:hypothetical protein